MKTTAIIAEYNPFHNGHLHHINRTREITNCDNIVVIMSGNFVQRGEPAFINKNIRTKMALLNNVDMVIELPVEYATGAADIFSSKAVELIKSLGIVDNLSFGSESGSIEEFNNIKDILYNEPAQFKSVLKDNLATGASYPLARQNALEFILNKDLSFLNRPNNILALEYLLALKDTNIKPITIPRIAASYNDKELSGNISSATAIRENILAKNYNKALEAIPNNCTIFFANYNDTNSIPVINKLSTILHYLLRTTSTDELAKIADITEGLENRIKSLSQGELITELTSKIKTKRYTYTKIQRALLHIILNIKKTDQINDIKYIRILGLKKEKMHLLSELHTKATLPIITNVKNNENLLKKEIEATDIYNIMTKKQIGNEYTNPLIII